jgi:hypothetical protein
MVERRERLRSWVQLGIGKGLPVLGEATVTEEINQSWSPEVLSKTAGCPPLHDGLQEWPGVPCPGAKGV